MKRIKSLIATLLGLSALALLGITVYEGVQAGRLYFFGKETSGQVVTDQAGGQSTNQQLVRFTPASGEPVTISVGSWFNGKPGDKVGVMYFLDRPIEARVKSIEGILGESLAFAILLILFLFLFAAVVPATWSISEDPTDCDGDSYDSDGGICGDGDVD